MMPATASGAHSDVSCQFSWDEIVPTMPNRPKVLPVSSVNGKA